MAFVKHIYSCGHEKRIKARYVPDDPQQRCGECLLMIKKITTNDTQERCPAAKPWAYFPSTLQVGTCFEYRYDRLGEKATITCKVTSFHRKKAVYEERAPYTSIKKEYNWAQARSVLAELQVDTIDLDVTIEVDGAVPYQTSVRVKDEAGLCRFIQK